MAVDVNGLPLDPGDTVVIWGVVKTVSAGEDSFNVTVETMETTPLSEQKVLILVNARQVQKVHLDSGE